MQYSQNGATKMRDYATGGNHKHNLSTMCHFYNYQRSIDMVTISSIHEKGRNVTLDLLSIIVYALLLPSSNKYTTMPEKNTSTDAVYYDHDHRQK